MDPFSVLGLKPTMGLDPNELESLYLRLSREAHPDHHRSASAEEQVAVLERSAQLNDAYRQLEDPWSRARAIVELREPGVMERTKKLSGAFLMEAMELSEEVAEVAPENVDPLRTRIEERVTAILDTIREQLGNGDAEPSAVLLHQSRYFRKALEELEARA